MLQIGTDDRGLLYEGTSHYGRAVWPAPVITPAKIVFTSDGPLEAARSNDPITSAWRFREDFFDPIARIRRGRFYTAENVRMQPIEWHVQPHPAMPNDTSGNSEFGLTKSLNTFYSAQVHRKFIKDQREQPLVLLGLDERFTVWTIINIEAISTGEDLVTLRARSSLGILPDIDTDEIPGAFRRRVHEALDSFTDEVHRSAPVSVIDRARDAASQILLAYYGATGKDAKDLGKLANRLEEEKKIVAAGAAKIIARLHARAKPVEKERRAMRAIREQDAELATQCVGTILCELGWAEWT